MKKYHKPTSCYSTEKGPSVAPAAGALLAAPAMALGYAIGKSVARMFDRKDTMNISLEKLSPVL